MPKVKEENLKTVQKLEEEFGATFKHNLKDGKISALKCITYKHWELQTKSLKNFNLKLVSQGATTINKE